MSSGVLVNVFLSNNVEQPVSKKNRHVFPESSVVNLIEINQLKQLINFGFRL